MLDTALFSLTWRVVRRRLVAFRRSPWRPALAFPALVAWIGFGDSYGTAAKFFFFLLPHVFLVAAQDAVRTDVESGALENVLFLGGRFRGYLRAKLFVLAAAAGSLRRGPVRRCSRPGAWPRAGSRPGSSSDSGSRSWPGFITSPWPGR